MPDKRSIQTKSFIKEALVMCLREDSFENLNVTSICNKAAVSRTAFYRYYEDKYSVVAEIFAAHISECETKYDQLCVRNIDDTSVMTKYSNLLEAILYMYFENYCFYEQVTYTKNPYLYSMHFKLVYHFVRKFMRRNKELKTKYPINQTASLLCNSMFGLIDSCIDEKMHEHEIRNMAHDVFSTLLYSNLFY